jgi:hypothetical protein
MGGGGGGDGAQSRSIGVRNRKVLFSGPPERKVRSRGRSVCLVLRENPLLFLQGINKRLP